jgi:hypothetical protein
MIHSQASKTRLIAVQVLSDTITLIMGRATTIQKPQAHLKAKCSSPICLHRLSHYQILMLKTGTTPSPAAPAMPPNGADPPSPSTKKKRCISSSTIESTSARCGRRCVKTSTADFPIANGAGFKEFSVSSTDSSRRRNVPRCVSSGECRTASSCRRV